jgi:hypothetical protein
MHPNTVPFPAYPSFQASQQKSNFKYRVGDSCHFCGSPSSVITIWTVKSGRFAGQQLAKCNETNGGCGKLLGSVINNEVSQMQSNDESYVSSFYQQNGDAGNICPVNENSTLNELLESVHQMKQEIYQLRLQITKSNKFLSSLLLQIRDMCNSERSHESAPIAQIPKKNEINETQKQKNEEIDEIQDFEEDEEMKVFTQQTVKKPRMTKTSN